MTPSSPILKGPTPTQQVRLLAQELKKRGIQVEVEYYDGHKHIDIAILNSKIFIEVDGLHHFTESKQIMSDFKRDHYSDGDDFAKIRIPNIVIEHYLSKVVVAIVEVAQFRAREKH